MAITQRSFQPVLNKTAASFVTIPGTPAYPVGSVLLVQVTADNVSGTTPNVTSISSPANETATWTIYNSMQSGRTYQTAAGADVAVTLAYLVTTIPWNSGSITVNFDSSPVAKTASVWEIGSDAGYPIVFGLPRYGDDTSSSGATFDTTKEVFVHVGHESNTVPTSVGTMTAATGGTQTSGGGAAANVAQRMFRGLPASTTSPGTVSATVDYAWIALEINEQLLTSKAGSDGGSIAASDSSSVSASISKSATDSAGISVAYQGTRGTRVQVGDISTLVDTFDTFNDPLYYTYGDIYPTHPPTMVVSNGRLYLNTDNGDNSSVGLETEYDYALTNSSLVVEADLDPDLKGYGGTVSLINTYGLPADELYVRASSSGNIRFKAGTATMLEEPYNRTAHRFIRFRNTSGTNYIEVSPDGVNWTVKSSVAYSGGDGWRFYAANNYPLASMWIDNLNVIQKIGSESRSLSVSDNSAVTQSITASDTGGIRVNEGRLWHEPWNNSDAWNNADAFDEFWVGDQPWNGIVKTTSTATQVNASDTGSIAASETRTIANSSSVTDTGSIATTESRAIATTSSATDTGQISVSETTTRFVTLVASDTAALAVSEVQASSLSSTRTDAGTVAVSETTSGSVVTNATDTASIAVTENRNIDTAQPGQDSASVGLADVASINKSSSTNDSNSLGISEATSTSVVLSSTDTGSIAIAEDASITVFALKTGTDTSSLAVTEQTQTNVSTSGSDNNSLGVTEASTAFKSVVATDATSVTLAENSSVSITQPGQETISLGVVETAVLSVTTSTSDSSSIAVSETRAINSTLNRVDTLALNVSDVSATQISSSATDTGTIAGTDIGNVDSRVPGTENIGVGLTETVEIYIESESSDATGLGVDETIQSSLTSESSWDAAGVKIVEETSFNNTAVASDQSSVSVTEQASIYVNASVSASDSSGIAVSETSGTFFTALGQDTGILVVSETSSIVVGGGSDKAASEVRSIGVSESSSVVVSLTATELQPIGVSEAGNFATIPTVTTDSASIAASEARSLFVTITRTDQNSIAVTEDESFETITRAATDSGSVGVSETSTVQKVFIGADISTIAVTETSAVEIGGTIAKAGSDGNGLRVTESNSRFITLSRNDSGSLAVSESRAFGPVNFATADSATIALTETTSKFNIFSSTEYFSIGLTEESDLDAQDATVYVSAIDASPIRLVERSKRWVVGARVVPIRFVVSDKPGMNFALKVDHGTIVNTAGSTNEQITSSGRRNKSIE